MKRFTYALVMIQLGMGSYLMAQEEAPPGRDQSMWQTLIMVAVAMAFFYLILWRPEQKRRLAMEEARKSLKKGDRVSAMGILGTVSKIQEHTVILQMVDGSKIEVLKATISDILPENPADEKKVEQILDKDDE